MYHLVTRTQCRVSAGPKHDEFLQFRTCWCLLLRMSCITLASGGSAVGMGRKAAWQPIAVLLAEKATQRTARGRAVADRRELCGSDISTYTAVGLLPDTRWGLAVTASKCQSGSSSQPPLNRRPRHPNLLQRCQSSEWILPSTCSSCTSWMPRQARSPGTSSGVIE